MPPRSQLLLSMVVRSPTLVINRTSPTTSLTTNPGPGPVHNGEASNVRDELYHPGGGGFGLPLHTLEGSESLSVPTPSPASSPVSASAFAPSTPKLQDETRGLVDHSTAHTLDCKRPRLNSTSSPNINSNRICPAKRPYYSNSLTKLIKVFADMNSHVSCSSGHNGG